MAETLMRDPSGKIWEERDGKWYEVGGARAGGMLAGADMGVGEGLLVGAGRELTRLGRGARSLLAQATGDDATVKRLADQEDEASSQIAGSKAAGARGIGVGEMLPGLATLPLGLGVGGAAARGLGALAEQAAVSGLMGGIGHSGDQGMDAMTGALMGAGGWGTGMLAGRVMGAIKQRGVAARMAVMEANDAARAGSGAIDAGAGGAGSGAAGGGAPGAPGAAGAGAAAGGVADDPLRFGQATRPGAEAIAGGGGVPGAAAGAPGLTPENARLAGRAEQLGIQLTPGQRTGSTVQMMAEESLKSSPYSAGLFERQVKGNIQRVNELAVRAIGEDGSELSQRVLNNAHVRIGQVFDDVAGHVGTVRAGSEVLDNASSSLRAIATEAGEGGAIVPEVGAAATRLMNVWESGGQITGSRLMRERTKLVKRGRQFSRDGDQLGAEGIQDIVGVIDDVIRDTVPRQVAERVGQARAQWRVLSSLETGSAIAADGKVNTGALFPALRREFPMEMERGNFATTFGRSATGAPARDLMDAVRITQAFKSVVGNSGTATRMSMQGLINNPILATLHAAGLNLGGRAYMGGGGMLASELAGAPNALPGAGAAAGGAARGLLGGLGL